MMNGIRRFSVFPNREHPTLRKIFCLYKGYLVFNFYIYLIMAVLFCSLSRAQETSSVSESTPHATDSNTPDAQPQNTEEEVVETLDEVQTVNPAAEYYGEAYPQFDRIFDHYTARNTRKHHVNTLIAHRNFQPMATRPFRDFLGFDGGGLKIVLLARVGITSWLDFGILRQNATREAYTTYEVDTKWQALTQEKHVFDLGFRTGFSWFNEAVHNRIDYFGQFMLDRVFFHRWLINTGLIYHSHSSSPFKTSNNLKSSIAWLLSQEIRFIGLLSLGAELTLNIGGYHEKYPILTFGPKFITNRHCFSIVISNTQYMSSDSIIVNTPHIHPKHWVLGFHITREI
jgi:hypothetical protein